MAAGVGSTSVMNFATNPALVGANKIAKFFKAANETLKTHYARQHTNTMKMVKKAGRYMVIFGEGSPNPASVVPEYAKHTLQQTNMLDQKQYDIQRIVTGYMISQQTYDQWITETLGDPIQRAAEYCTEAVRLYEENYWIGELVYSVTGRTTSTNLSAFVNLDLLCADGQPVFTTAGHTYLGTAGIANINVPGSQLDPTTDAVIQTDIMFARFVNDKGGYLDNEIDSVFCSKDLYTNWQIQLKNRDNPNTANRAENPVGFTNVKRGAVLLNQLPNNTAIFQGTIASKNPVFYKWQRVVMQEMTTFRKYDEDREAHMIGCTIYERIMAPYRGEGYIFNQTS